MWRVWCRVLATVPELVLWSIREPAFGVPNLVNFALQQGVKKTQLVFTPRIQRADHMRVKAAAALYLDTWVNILKCHTLWFPNITNKLGP